MTWELKTTEKKITAEDFAKQVKNSPYYVTFGNDVILHLAPGTTACFDNTGVRDLNDIGTEDCGPDKGTVAVV